MKKKKLQKEIEKLREEIVNLIVRIEQVQYKTAENERSIRTIWDDTIKIQRNQALDKYREKMKKAYPEDGED